MPVRLSQEEVVTIRVLASKGQNHFEIARTVGVTESTVRYHLQRAAAGAADGRRDKEQKAETMAEVIVAWHAERDGAKRPVNVTAPRFGKRLAGDPELVSLKGDDRLARVLSLRVREAMPQIRAAGNGEEEVL